MKDAARNTVLGAIRHHLAVTRRGEGATTMRIARPAPPSPSGDREELVAAFAERLGAVGGVAWRVGDLAAAAQCVDGILAESGGARVALGDSALVAALRTRLAHPASFVAVDDRAGLADCEVGITAVRAAIAETGSLLLDSASERYRLVSLLPAVHIALVPIDVLLPDLDAALALLGAEPAAAVTLVTGPSRTADIELTLAIGVHGPKALHVVLVDDALAI